VLQDKVFSDFEGDRWFERNQRALNTFNPEADLPLRLITLYGLTPGRVLEIGAANGFRLAQIHQRTGAEAVALEPSARAVLDGKVSFPFITFIRGTASAVPLRESFDLVIISFVFHWIDRHSLLRVVAEIDRLVNEGGYLLIADFHPVNHLQVRYHHLQEEEVFTYKQDYAATFLASGLYHPVSFLSTHHSNKELRAHVDENERIGTWLLRKDLQAHYVPVARNNDRG
jgi:SAM-dependent methyltransferase